MLVPLQRLWQGLQLNRGPPESAGTSGRSSGILYAAADDSTIIHAQRLVRVGAAGARQSLNSTLKQDAAVPTLPPPSSSPSERSVRVRAPPVTTALVTSQEASAAAASTKKVVKGRVLVSYDEESSNAEPSYTAVEAALGGKPLKINVDLLLYRCRQQRIEAMRTTDAEARRKALQAAEAGLRRCLQLDVADPRTYVVLGKLLLQQRRLDEARALYVQGCTFTGNLNPYIWSAWGWLEFRFGEVDRARKMYDAAVVVDETHACAWHKWGMLEKSQGNYRRARDLWVEGIRRCKRKPQASNAYLYNALAVMAAELDRVQEARAWFEEGTRTVEGAGSVALWQAWAMLEVRKGDPGSVRYLFRQALQANPKSRYTHLAWAMWERKQGNRQLCIELLSRGNSLNPTDAAIFQAWGIVEKEAGHIDEARRLFEAGTQASLSHIPLWQAWGVMEFEQGNLERARQLFQQGVWSDPRNRDVVYVFHAWARLERSVGSFDVARELFRAAIKVEPKNDVVWNTWIDMERDQGNLTRADELTMRRTEQQWDFEVPAGFSTRPDQSPLSALVGTLSSFFKLRGNGSSSSSNGAGPLAAIAIPELRPQMYRADGAGRATAAASSPPLRPGARGTGGVRDYLPDDYRPDLLPGDVLPEVANIPLARRSDRRQGGGGRGSWAAEVEGGGDGCPWDTESQHQADASEEVDPGQLVDQGPGQGGLLSQSPEWAQRAKDVRRASAKAQKQRPSVPGLGRSTSDLLATTTGSRDGAQPMPALEPRPQLTAPQDEPLGTPLQGSDSG